MGIGSLNPILKRLMENCWLTRRAHETDKRTSLIFLNEIKQSILTHLAAWNFEAMDLLELMKQLRVLQKQLAVINMKC